MQTNDVPFKLKKLCIDCNVTDNWCHTTRQMELFHIPGSGYVEGPTQDREDKNPAHRTQLAFIVCNSSI